jgi:hypothetical protein
MAMETWSDKKQGRTCEEFDYNITHVFLVGHGAEPSLPTKYIVQIMLLGCQLNVYTGGKGR